MPNHPPQTPRDPSTRKTLDGTRKQNEDLKQELALRKASQHLARKLRLQLAKYIRVTLSWVLALYRRYVGQMPAARATAHQWMTRWKHHYGGKQVDSSENLSARPEGCRWYSVFRYRQLRKKLSSLTTSPRVSKEEQRALFLLGIYAGLFLPDIDLLLLPVLFHRSILTHSILLALVVGTFTSHSFYVGLLYGIGCHLLADSTGAMVGFGMIWLPIIIVPLGPILSWIWIVANAILCLRLAFRKRPIHKGAFVLLVAGILAISTLTYGTATYALAVVGAVAMWIQYRRFKRASRLKSTTAGSSKE